MKQESDVSNMWNFVKEILTDATDETLGKLKGVHDTRRHGGGAGMWRRQ
jgi:hypothetical protein